MSRQIRPKRTPEQWQQLIDEQAASGQSQAAFCAAQGLSQTTFQYWKRRLKADGAVAWSQSKRGAVFTPLRPTGAALAPGADTDQGWELELDLGGGVCLRFRRQP